MLVFPAVCYISGEVLSVLPFFNPLGMKTLFFMILPILSLSQELGEKVFEYVEKVRISEKIEVFTNYQSNLESSVDFSLGQRELYIQYDDVCIFVGVIHIGDVEDLYKSSFLKKGFKYENGIYYTDDKSVEILPGRDTTIVLFYLSDYFYIIQDVLEGIP